MIPDPRALLRSEISRTSEAGNRKNSAAHFIEWVTSLFEWDRSGPPQLTSNVIPADCRAGWVYHVTARRASLLCAADLSAMHAADVVAYAGDIHGELLDHVNPAAIRYCLHDVAEHDVIANCSHSNVVRITTC